MNWHDKTVDETLLMLNTDSNIGLNEKEAEKNACRLQQVP